MKTYSVYDLSVVKVGTGDNVRYLICKYNEFTDTYIEVLTKEKIKISDKTCVEPLSNYYSLLAQCNYTTGKPLTLNKKQLLQKYITINSEINLVQIEEKAEKSDAKVPIDVTSSLEKATLEFFPKTGEWWSNCFRRPIELGMANLPCHLRDDVWLAKMLKKDQNLFYMSYSKILDYVKTSQFFQEKRHEYELEIVKWQINYMRNGGDGWICDDNYGGDICFLTPVCDLAFRKGVVDTLSKIGMNKDVIEEGLEKFADLWREIYMSSAFRNEYEPVFYLSAAQVEPAEEEHKENWLKIRRYEYYKRHKKSVDLYGSISHDMLMSMEEVAELREYLDNKHQERKQYIDEVKSSGYGNARTLKK